jgi:hypothetical protein
VGQFFERGEPAMKKTPDSSRRLSDHVLRALNQIRKPSAAGEITELLNRDLELEDRPLQETDDTVLTLYWLRARPRSSLSR